jgi:hypothetical protein
MVERISVKEILKKGLEEDFENAIGNFVCKDKEVENFLKTKAFDFDRRNKSRTYLIVDIAENGDLCVLAYYSVTMKSLKFSHNISATKIKKIDGFRSDVEETEAVLIGQLGKDCNHKDKIDGKSIMSYIFETVYVVHNAVGGRIAFLECTDNEKVVKFYQDNGFVFLQNSEGGKYLQMIRFL